MANCEMCGSTRNLTNAIVEGVSLIVCENCAKFGKVIVARKTEKSSYEKKSFTVEPQIVYEIVSDYYTKIKEARERMNLRQEELALKISEKTSEIHNLESGKIKLSFQLARKLEKFLNIAIIEQLKDEKPTKINFKDSNVTIGDIIKLKKSQNE
ncbi:MAG: multiprotein bridging factor aMBF1 [Nanoarchaeota archaeon]